MTRLWLAAVVAITACQSGSRSKPVGPTAVTPELTEREIESATIASIEIKGLETLSKSTVRQAVRSESGTRIERDVLRDDLRRIMAIRGVSDARVDAVRVGDDGVGLVFVVTEAPRIAGVELDGNSVLGDSELMAVTTTTVGQHLDPLEARKGAAAIRRRYRLAGYYKAQVAVEITKPGDGAIVVYKVTEGARVVIDKISFPGAKSLKEAELARLLAGKSTSNKVGSAWVRDQLDDGTQRITKEYYDRGFINLKIGEHVVRDIASDRIELIIPIEEGPQFRLGTIRVTGRLAAPLADYMSLIKSRTGDVFNRTRVGADIQRIAAFQLKLSGNEADFVTPLTNVDVDKRIIDIDFDIDR